MASTTKTKVFVSFDYDHDLDLKTLLVGQSRHADSPFFIEDHSIKVETKCWKADARKRIKRCDVVIVICGHQTHQAVGVTAEIEIARRRAFAACSSGDEKRAWPAPEGHGLVLRQHSPVDLERTEIHHHNQEGLVVEIAVVRSTTGERSRASSAE